MALSLLALTVGFGLSTVVGAREHVEQVIEIHNDKVRRISETQVASLRRADTVEALILETDPFRQDEIFKAFLKYGFQVGDGRNGIRALLSSDAERAVMAQQDAIIAEAVVLHDEIADLHAAGYATFQSLRDPRTQAADVAIGKTNAAYHATLGSTIAAKALVLAASISTTLLMYRTSDRIARHLHANVGNLRQMAMHDSPTGLLNRSTITQLIGSKIIAAEHFALLDMDLDGFKRVNDDHGHDVGDQLLKMAAARIRGRKRGIDMVARMGATSSSRCWKASTMSRNLNMQPAISSTPSATCSCTAGSPQPSGSASA